MAAVLSVVAFGIGTTYPVGTVSIQNAVSRYQVGAAMGGMNFFRGLAAAFIVAVMGAIVLGGIGVAPTRASGAAGLAVAAHAAGGDLAHVSPWRVCGRRALSHCEPVRAPPHGGASIAWTQRGYPAAGRVARMSQRVRASAAR